MTNSSVTMHLLGVLVDACHYTREFIIYHIINGHDAIVEVLPVEASLDGLVGVQKPMVTDKSWMLQPGTDITVKAPGALTLAGNTSTPPRLCWAIRNHLLGRRILRSGMAYRYAHKLQSQEMDYNRSN